MDLGRFPSLFVPPICPLCRHRLDSTSLICGGCTRSLNRSPLIRNDPPEGLRQIVSCADHRGVARDLLAAFKFRRMTGLAGLIAGFMADAIGSVAEGTILVPVPPAPMRTWLRGFDPVAMLTAEIAGLTGIRSLEENPILRRGSRRQRGRDRAGRLAAPPEIRSKVGAGKTIGKRSILLVDDVTTTGATLAAAAAVLRLEGASTVDAVTFSRRL